MTSADFPIVVRGGRVLLTWSGTVALALAIAAWVRLEAKTDNHERRVAQVEAATKDVATKQDVQDVARRVDRILELMLERQQVDLAATRR